MSTVCSEDAVFLYDAMLVGGCGVVWPRVMSIVMDT